MKNPTFAAYRHLPTDAVHILDLALFSKQRTPDAAMSLACEYIDYEGEKAFAVIASGEPDEPGVAYLPLTEDQNRDIMEAWFESFNYANPEYRFLSDDNFPQHVVVVVEFIEPENA